MSKCWTARFVFKLGHVLAAQTKDKWRNKTSDEIKSSLLWDHAITWWKTEIAVKKDLKKRNKKSPCYKYKKEFFGIIEALQLFGGRFTLSANVTVSLLVLSFYTPQKKQFFGRARDTIFNLSLHYYSQYYSSRLLLSEACTAKKLILEASETMTHLSRRLK